VWQESSDDYHTHAMDRTDLHFADITKLFKPGFHLSRGFIRKGDRTNTGWVCTCVQDNLDLGSQTTCLTTAGARINENGGCRGYSIILFIVQTVFIRHFLKFQICLWGKIFLHQIMG
jgi:hypothetical protein